MHFIDKLQGEYYTHKFLLSMGKRLVYKMIITNSENKIKYYSEKYYKQNNKLNWMNAIQLEWYYQMKEIFEEKIKNK